MKLKSKFLGLAAIAAMTIGFASFSTPASATVQTCTQWPATPLTSYPRDGHLFKCFPAPRNSNEQTLQSQMMNSVSSAVARLTLDEQTKLKNANVQIRVFYNGTDATQTLGESPSLPPHLNESGRSWVLPGNNTANLPIATTSVWIFTLTEFNALNGAIPTTFTASQSGGTTNHELGHQLDRVWAVQNNLAVAATALMSFNATSSPRAAQAVAEAVLWDYSQPGFDWTTAKTTQFYTVDSNGHNAIKQNEVFAEFIAAFNGGGVLPAEDLFLGSNFKCTTNVMAYLQNHNGAMLSAPDPQICYNHTAW